MVGTTVFLTISGSISYLKLYVITKIFLLQSRAYHVSGKEDVCFQSIKLLTVCSRYASKELPIKPTCSHKDKKLQCSTITMIDLQNFHKSFYAINDKLKQIPD